MHACTLVWHKHVFYLPAYIKLNTMLTYPNAVDENGEVHSIESITNDNRYDHKYYCLGCGKEMVPVLCNENKTSHFRHKVNDEGCNKETYLHNYCKKYLAKQFETQPHFYVSYYAINDCPHKDSCQLFKRHQWDKCSGTALHQFDLKEQYDTCQIEGSYAGFRADVLLTSSKNPDTRPIFLEVSVSHDCTPEKIDSLNKIIEIKVECEDDIKRPIVENLGYLVPAPDPRLSYQYGNCKIYKPIKKFIIFHNFSHLISRDDLCKLDVFALFPGNVGHTYKETIPCSKAGKKFFKDSVFELSVLKHWAFQEKNKNDLFNLGFSQAMLRDDSVRHCAYCTEYGSCCVLMPYEYTNSKTGEKVIVKRSVRNAFIKEDQLNKFKLSSVCSRWRLNTRKCHDVMESFKNDDVIIWSSK